MMLVGMPANAQDSAESLFAEAQAIYSGQETSSSELNQMKLLFDRIVEQYPSSDLAVAILLQETVDGFDLAQFASQLDRTTETPEGVSASQTDSQDEQKNFSIVPRDCISTSFGEAPNQQILVLVELDANGHVLGVPELVLPENPNALERRSFLSLVGAIDECAPFMTDQFAGGFHAFVSKEGSVTLTGLAQTPRMEAAERPSSHFSKQSGNSNKNKISPNEVASNVPAQLPPASPQSEAAMELDEGAIRDIQARLLVLGLDPNGIDGIVGSGFRDAVKKWQAYVGTEINGYLNVEQVAALKIQSKPALEAWLSDPENERLYNPPPPIAIGPGNVSGSWRFTSNCGSKSRIGKVKITGVLSIGHAGGNRYSGRARNSQGMNGNFQGQLTGRRMNGEINWGFLIGRVQFRGTFADQKLVISGRDTNGCSFYAAKSG
ncbi:peptidoglycan-binding protein [Ruegeria pomeroyi]|nr:peptidoglycan-binding protein [Ruegeria pomeroyi]